MNIVKEVEGKRCGHSATHTSLVLIVGSLKCVVSLAL